MKVELFVFSGTGNTLKIAREVGKRLSERGWEVNLNRMEKSSGPDIPDGSMVGLAFTTAFFSTYPVVLDFISKLPEGKERKIFMVTTAAGATGGSEGIFRRMVEAKGYVPVGSLAVVMPSNYNNKTLPAEKNSKLIEAGVEKARGFADRLVSGTAEWRRGIPLFPSMWHWFVTSGKALKLFYRLIPIQVNGDVCIRCLRCVNNCPAGALVVEGDVPVIIPAKCQSCQRCVAFCPVHAIGVPGKPLEQYRAMSFEEFIK